MRRSFLPLWLFCLLLVSCDAETPPVSTSEQATVATRAQALAMTATWYQYPPSIPGCFDGYASDCGSGTLLVGRGRVGFEPHAPNTVNGTCPDGDAGTFHAHGSVDSIRIRTLDGEPLREDRTVQVDVNVWGGTEPGELRLYHAADVRAPAWVEMGSASVVPGPQVVSFSYVLPRGVPFYDLHAVRAALRSPGSAEPCVPGEFHDHDDLAFRTARAPELYLHSPVEGATVSGSVPFEVYVADRSERISFLEFRRGTTVLATAPATPYPGEPYTFTWNSLEVVDGTYELSFRAVYGQGSETTASVRVNVVNGRVPPVVSITSPASGATVQGQVSIRAELRDDTGLSWWAVILDGGPWLCVDGAYGTSFSLACPWDTLGLANGSHVIEVRAYDGMGLETRVSTTVQVDNDKVPPTVTLSAPVEGALLSGTVSLEAQASDASGISRVDFYAELPSGSRYLGSDAVAPYAFSWDTRTVANGTWPITARALDGARNEATSPAVTVTVDNGVVPPVVSLDTPGPGATLSGIVQLQARATDNVGIARVDFYAGATLLGSATGQASSSYYSLTWSTRLFPNGTQTLTVRAVDLEGAESTSAPVTVTLNNDLTPPTVSLTSPVNGATLTGPVTLLASASDDRGVAYVEFCLSTSCFSGVDTTAPYSLALKAGDIPNGPQVLTARAYDAAGNRTTSTPVEVRIDNEFIRPTLSITSPLEGALVDGTVSIELAASDNVGVTRVECVYYENGTYIGTLIGSDTTAPYAISWSTTGLRDDTAYTLSCTAYDPTGNTAVATRTLKVHRNRLPTVSFLQPLAGSTVTGPVNLRVSASDDYGIARVEYYDLSGALLGSSTTAPSYEVVWNTARHPDGSFSLKARAIDVKGAMTEVSNAVVISNPPTVSFGSPAEGSVLRGSVMLSAAASDASGISKVEFYAGGVLLGTSTASPYWVPLHSRSFPNGSVLLSAKAFDTRGNAATATVNVILDNDFTKPAVRLASPVGGAVLVDTVTLVAEASDTGGSGLARVEFYDDGRLLGSDMSPPYEVTWSTRTSPQPSGAHTLVVQAWDNAGNLATSEPVEVTLDNTVPTVSLVPPQGSPLSGTVTLQANASDDRGVALVEFFVNGTQVGADSTAPYSVEWSSRTVPNGTVTLSARAVDLTGNIGDSSHLELSVSNDFTAPTVRLTAPTAGATVSRTVTLSATASDDRAVTRVEFYVGSTLVGTDTSAPYSVTWDSSGSASGSYTLTPKAYDAAGNVGTGTAVTVTLKNPGKV